MTQHTATGEVHNDALDWLSGRLRWERILRDLHQQAEEIEPTPAEDEQGERAA